MRNNILKIIRYGIPVAAAAAVGVLYGKLPKNCLLYTSRCV